MVSMPSTLAAPRCRGVAATLRRAFGALIASAVGALAPVLAAPAPRPATPSEVDPFIGVDGGGNVGRGAQVPFGFAAPGPDRLRPRTSGYRSGQPVLGLSQTHVSGTGGAGKYGNFRVTPQVGRLRLPPHAPRPRGQRAAPGYHPAPLP